jgi:hypothetical protein
VAATPESSSVDPTRQLGLVAGEQSRTGEQQEESQSREPRLAAAAGEEEGAVGVACVLPESSVALHCTVERWQRGPRGSLSARREREGMTPSCSQIELRRAATMATGVFRSLGRPGEAKGAGVRVSEVGGGRSCAL